MPSAELLTYFRITLIYLLTTEVLRFDLDYTYVLQNYLLTAELLTYTLTAELL